MKLLKNVTFALCLLTAFGTQYASDMKPVTTEDAAATEEQYFILICQLEKIEAPREFVESCQTLTECLAWTSQEDKTIKVEVIKASALRLLIELHAKPECADEINALDVTTFQDLVKASDYLNLKSKVYDVILDRLHKEFSTQSDRILKAEYVLNLPYATALEMLSKEQDEFIIAQKLKVVHDNPRYNAVFASWSPDDSMALTIHNITGDEPIHEVKVWDIATGEILRSLIGHTSIVDKALWAHDNSKIITTYLDGTAKVWNAQTGELLIDLLGHTAELKSAVASFDNSKVATISYDKTAKIWDMRTGALIRDIATPEEFVNSIDWSHDNRMVAISYYNKTINIWNVETGILLYSLTGHEDSVEVAKWSHDDAMIVTASNDGSVKIWNTGSYELIRNLNGHQGCVTSANWSSDDSMIVTSSCDKTAKVWDVKTGDLMLTLRGHRDWLYSAYWSPDDSIIITSSRDNTCKIWDAKSGELIQTIKSNRETTWSNYGKKIISISNGAPAIVWQLKSPAQHYANYEGIYTRYKGEQAEQKEEVDKSIIKRIRETRTTPDDAEQIIKRKRK